MKKTLTALLVVIFLINVFAGTTGKLTGIVSDKKTGEALPFVNVILDGTTIGAQSDLDGKYTILNIPPGTYKVRFAYVGYQSTVVQNVHISIDLTTNQNAALSESAVELAAIVVQGDVAKIQKDVTSSQARITADDILNLPVTEINDIIQLQAGVTKDANGDFHIRGG